jgi:hypothetical protein
MTQDYQVSSEIYSLENLQQAIRDFSDVCEIIYKQGVITISGESMDGIQEVFHEFMNYVLSL